MEYHLTEKAKTILVAAVTGITSDTKMFSANVEVDVKTGEVNIYPLYRNVTNGKFTFDYKEGETKFIRSHTMTEHGWATAPTTDSDV